MLLLLFGEFLENRAAPSVLRDARSARVEFEPASLGGDGNAQRVARKNHFAGTAGESGRAAGLAILAGAVNLHHALLACEPSRSSDLFDQRFDVGAEKLERLVAGLADEVEVARVPVRMLEPESAFAEIHLAGNPRVHHPLQGAVHGRPADAAIFLADQIDEVVCAEVPFLAEECVDDEIAFTGSFASSRAHAFNVNGSHARNG